MATFDASANVVVPLGDSASVSHTVGTGSNRLLVVSLGLNCGVAGVISTISVVYAGVACSMLGSATNAASAGLQPVRTEIWYLIAPPTGTANAVVTFSGGNATPIEMVTTSWTGVHQTVPFGTIATATGTNNTPTVAVGTVSGDVVIDSTGQNPDNSAIVAFTGSFPQTTIPTTQGAGGFYFGASYQTAVGVSTTQTWTSASAAANHAWAICAVGIKAVGATSGSSSTGTTVGEMRILPYRKGPSGFSPTSGVVENIQTNYEASAALPKVIMGTLKGNEIIWDDIITLPSVGPAGKLAVTTLPTRNSPRASLLVVTQNSLFQYPLLQVSPPAQADFPNLARAGLTLNSNPADLIPVFYPSGMDFGDLHTLRFVHIVMQNMTESDTVSISYRWDETNAWSPVRSSSDTETIWEFAEDNAGRVLWLAISINDGLNTDPVGPSARDIEVWCRPVTTDNPISQVPRTVPEVS